MEGLEGANAATRPVEALCNALKGSESAYIASERAECDPTADILSLQLLGYSQPYYVSIAR